MLSAWLKAAASLAIYGSFARGDIDERSDLDLLIIGEESEVNRDGILKLQDSLDREVQLTVLPYYRWEAMKKDGRWIRRERHEETRPCERCPAMRLKECIDKGLIKKDLLASEGVESSLMIAERFLRSSSRNLEIDEYEMERSWLQ